MKVRKFHQHSSFLGQTMPIAIYGHYGTPMLAFPTASADFEEFERQGMVQALEPFINGGVIKLVTIDSINGQSWSNRSCPVHEAARLHQAYDDYVSKEVVGAIYEDCQGALPIATLGASFGAYHAMNTLLKHPETFRWAFGLSGFYDLTEYFGQEFDHNCYRNSPRHYLPELRQSPAMADVLQTKITLICGQGPWERVHWTTDFSRLLESMGVPHELDLWGHDVAHDWPWWFKQMNLHLSKGLA